MRTGIRMCRAGGLFLRAGLLFFVVLLSSQINSGTVAYAQLKPGQASAQPVFPGKTWDKIEKPESIGYSSERLNALRAWVGSLDTTSMMVSVGGKSLFEYGDMTHLSYLASVRKSLLAIMYGKYVENGTIQLSKTLGEIGITDVGGLLPQELQATVENLITARSGVYHPASNSGDSTASAPPRGSQKPGTYYLYNNWDFNAAGAVFEKLTGEDIYDVLETELAKPIGMEDFNRSAQRKSGDATRSQHMAYHIFLSVRDMARVGLLMLRGGQWSENQVASRAWVKRISSLVTPLNEMNPPGYRSLGSGNRWGYGCMWWVWDAPNSPGPFEGAFTGIGAGGQYITVIPKLDMVVAHKTDTSQRSAHGQRNRSVTQSEYDAILRMLIAAQCPGGKCSEVQTNR
ncbi:MAG: beta-lactamase family protein [Acidobacteriia bacterium]|nr:beta-lactamase family protein [Terriglobia bacterium]